MAEAKLHAKFSFVGWLSATIKQLKQQHKVFRIFTMKYDATLQDASAAPTAGQKISVLYTLVRTRSRTVHACARRTQPKVLSQLGRHCDVSCADHAQNASCSSNI